MKKSLLMLLSICFFYSCKKNDTVIDKDPILEIGVNTIDVHDNRMFSFSMKKDSVYTILFDYTNCIEKNKGYFWGLDATIWMDWGVDNQSYVCGPSYSYSGIEDYRNPKLALCVIPKENFIYKISNPNKSDKYDGSLTISINYGDELFTKGIVYKTIQEGDYTSKNIAIYSDKLNKVCFDFSNHTFDLDGGEPKGWLNSWLMQVGNIESGLKLYVGTLEHPRALITKTATFIVPVQTTWTKIRVYDIKSSDDSGVIKYGSGTEPL